MGNLVKPLKTKCEFRADEEEAIPIVCGLFLTENSKQKDQHPPDFLAVVLSYVFMISLHVSATLFSDWLHIIFSGLWACSSSGNTPHTGILGDDNQYDKHPTI